ncbi:MAG TPA: hypothetical protein VM580_04855, partial [Labilithrix sp.]|nr:hypothetical protein [Labilithrix sp.]
FVAGAVFIAGALPTGCSEGESSTTGRRISLDVKIAASAASKQFSNSKGWNVTITKAVVATGPLYFYDGEAILAGTGSKRRVAPPRGAIKSAFAHPGHYVPGNAKGELRTGSSADLLVGATLGVGEGVSGVVRSATFSFSSPARGPFAGELGSHAMVIEGTATKTAETRIFRAEIRADEVSDANGLPQIEGCPFAEADMTGDGIVTVSVGIATWFDNVEFEGLPASVDGAPVLMTDSLARNQLVRGTRGASAYSFSYASR